LKAKEDQIPKARHIIMADPKDAKNTQEETKGKKIDPCVGDEGSVCGVEHQYYILSTIIIIQNNNQNY